MRQQPSRFRRLDGALADLPVEEPMLLTELDGFLTGLLICPEVVPTDEWMAAIWGVDNEGLPAFEDPLDSEWFVKAVTARRDEIARDLSRDKLQPILDVDERDGEVLWEYWLDGFAEAIELRPDVWHVLTGAPEGAEPWSRLMALIAIARDESDLDSVEVNAFQDRAVADAFPGAPGVGREPRHEGLDVGPGEPLSLPAAHPGTDRLQHRPVAVQGDLADVAPRVEPPGAQGLERGPVGRVVRPALHVRADLGDPLSCGRERVHRLGVLTSAPVLAFADVSTPRRWT
ncbi:MAG: YecA family protein, partial [Sphingomonas sp.]